MHCCPNGLGVMQPGVPAAKGPSARLQLAACRLRSHSTLTASIESKSLLELNLGRASSTSSKPTRERCFTHPQESWISLGELGADLHAIMADRV